MAKKRQNSDFSLSDWPVSGHVIFIFFSKKKKKKMFSGKFNSFLIFHFSYRFPHFPPPLLPPRLTFTSCPLSSTVVYFMSDFMSAVFTYHCLRLHCSYLSFTSCPLSSLTFFFVYTVLTCRSLHVRCVHLAYSSCPLFLLVVHFMSSVFTYRFLRVHCSYLSFTSCSLPSSVI